MELLNEARWWGLRPARRSRLSCRRRLSVVTDVDVAPSRLTCWAGRRPARPGVRKTRYCWRLASRAVCVLPQRFGRRRRPARQALGCALRVPALCDRAGVKAQIPEGIETLLRHGVAIKGLTDGLGTRLNGWRPSCGHDRDGEAPVVLTRAPAPTAADSVRPRCRKPDLAARFARIEIIDWWSCSPAPAATPAINGARLGGAAPHLLGLARATCRTCSPARRRARRSSCGRCRCSAFAATGQTELTASATGQASEVKGDVRRVLSATDSIRYDRATGQT